MGENLIVVGVDGSEGSRLALRWALHEAEFRGGTVSAVTTWHWEGIDEDLLDTTGPKVAQDHARDAMDREIDAILAEWQGVPPQVSREVVEGSPAEALVNAAADADLLVLGSHGHSRLHHVAMGSVSEAVMLHAACPVVFVPLPRTAQAAGSGSRTRSGLMPSWLSRRG